MRDEENAAPALAPVAHHGEHPLRKIGRQCRRDLVEDQELRVLGEGSGEIEHPERRERKVVDELSEIELQPHRREVRADRVDRRTCQAQVPGDREIGHERRVLEHRREPEPRRLSRRARTNRLSQTAMVPASDRITPESALTRVLFPAPLAPSSACTSPGAMTRSAERSATTARTASRSHGLRGAVSRRRSCRS